MLIKKEVLQSRLVARLIFHRNMYGMVSYGVMDLSCSQLYGPRLMDLLLVHFLISISIIKPSKAHIMNRI